MGLEIERIDETWVIQNTDRLWDWLGEQGERDKTLADRERRAEERHKQLLEAIATSTASINKTLLTGFNVLAAAIKQR